MCCCLWLYNRCAEQCAVHLVQWNEETWPDQQKDNDNDNDNDDDNDNDGDNDDDNDNDDSDNDNDDNDNDNVMPVCQLVVYTHVVIKDRCVNVRGSICSYM